MQPKPDPKSQGSMFLFWCVIGLAAVILGVYLVTWERGAGRMGSFPGAAEGILPAEERPASPEFSLQRVEGGDGPSSADLEGRVTVLHLWATWCPPCRSEFPNFAKYAAEHTSGDVQIIPLSLDENPQAVLMFLSSVNPPPPVYHDPSERLAKDLQTEGIPETLLIDRKGRIAFRAAGSQDWGPGGIPSLVERILSEE